MDNRTDPIQEACDAVERASSDCPMCDLLYHREVALRYEVQRLEGMLIARGIAHEDRLRWIEQQRTWMAWIALLSVLFACYVGYRG